MNHKLNMYIGIFLALAFVVGGIWGFRGTAQNVPPERQTARHAEVDELSLDDDPYCGPRAVYHALLLAGYPARPSEVLDVIKVTDDGTSMLQLYEYFQTVGVSVQLRDLNEELLLAHQGIAVLFLRRGHYVTVDARGTRAIDEVKVYDKGLASKWGQADLSGWGGDSIVVSKEWANEGHGLSFERLLWDVGHCDEGSIQTVRVPVQNRTNSAISFRAVPACGCTAVTPSTAQLHPGEKTVLEMQLDLEGRRGEFAIDATIVAEGYAPSTVRVQGRVTSSEIVVQRTVDFDVMTAGEARSRKLIVRNVKQIPLSVSDVKFAQGNTPSKLDDVSLFATVREWRAEDRSSRVPAIAMGRDGDKVIEIRLSSEDRAKPGERSGTLMFRSNQSSLPVEVPWNANIKSSVSALPGEILFTIAENQLNTKPVEVSLSGPYDFEIQDVSVESRHGESFIKASQADARKLSVEVDIPMDLGLLRDLYAGDIICTLQNGHDVTIPYRIIVFQ